MEIKPGQIWKHYKGNNYKIIVVARHSESLETLIVYERITDIGNTGSLGNVYARPLDMFFDHIEIDVYSGPRFEYLGE